MKKIALLGLLVLVLGMARAQDTIDEPYGKPPGYHLTYWFDDNCIYWTSPRLTYTFATNNLFAPGQVYTDSGYVGSTQWCRWDSVAHPTGIMGIGVMVTTNGYPPPTQPEYVCIMQYVGTDTLLVLDSVRWDTASYSILKFPMKTDTCSRVASHTEPKYFKFYEVNLTKPIVVDSIFYMTGTCNSGSQRLGYNCPYIPVAPGNPSYCGDIVPRNYRVWNETHVIYRLDATCRNGCFFGPFFFKVHEVLVKLYTEDPMKGTTDPGGMYSKYVEQQIHAYPNRGYRFTHWQDGDTNNPRHIILTQDTMLTAYFDTNESFTVSAVSESPSWGSVTGAGLYFAHEDVTLTAVPEPHYRFTHWSDGDVSNPRRFVVTCDTSFTAYFEKIPAYRISADVNDPALGYVTGSGTYDEGEEVSLLAIPKNYYQYKFLHWNDGDGANPRRFTATCDTSFTAIFGRLESVEQPKAVDFVVAPNPAREYVTITCKEQGKVRINIYDAAGTAVISRNTYSGRARISTRGLPSGTYFVVLSTAEGSSTQKLVIEN